ncbi:hypothetical protein SAMN06297251_103177 [Fulvimarina manganoxydans]|uniref:Polymerase nucleotidyl transferase domain-containing protein n=1 Tax=Fulvimarina manganoxydans TaxID=937218 RepID=A0A1W1ZWC7_9HYPH|nr:nucleotidyltransferase domain-containing protein [Fulvimarina manganoxydans]SMC52765.1 hypothetical protein SAMN06297251_103177 [Fulvimarina manganoxydans]
MKPSEALALHRETIRQILSRYPVINPRIFGSVARGEDTEESDLDILVERQDPLSYYDVFRIEDEIREQIGIRADLRLTGEFSERILKRLERDLQRL